MKKMVVVYKGAEKIKLIKQKSNLMHNKKKSK